MIVLTARDPQGNEQHTLEAGALAFFQKPADNDERLARIRLCLEDKRLIGGSLPS